MSTSRSACGRSLAPIPGFRGVALAALSGIVALASLAGGQTENSVRGTVLAEDGQPIPGVSVHGSVWKRCCPYQQDKGTTDKKGEFHLEHAGTVVHFSKSGLQPLAFVLKQGTTQVHIVMKPAENDLTFRVCVRPDSTQKLLGWGKYGLHFAVPNDGMQIFGGSPDVDYVRYVVKPDKSDSYLELWFGPYSISTEPDDEQFLGSVDFSQRNLVSAKGVYAEPGYLLFMRGDALMAQPFNVKRMQVTGTAIQIATGISVTPSINSGSFSVSQTGMLVYSSEAAVIGRELGWYDRQGKQLAKVGSPEYASYPELSPDGKRLAIRLFTQPGGSFEVWVYDLARGVHARESFTALTAVAPIWSPDGLHLAYSHSVPQVSGDHMYVLNVGGTGKEELLEQPFLESLANYPSSWSADGNFLLFDRQDKSGKISVWVLPMQGNRKPYPFLETQFNVHMAKFSLDGRWVAYVSNDSGKDEVYVSPFPGPGARVQVSAGGGTQPRWRKDGRELFYLSPQAKMMAAEVAAGAQDFRVGTLRELFALSGLGAVPGYLYDVTSDGEKFLVVQDFVHSSTEPLTLVVNWDAELKRK